MTDPEAATAREAAIRKLIAAMEQCRSEQVDERDVAQWVALIEQREQAAFRQAADHVYEHATADNNLSGLAASIRALAAAPVQPEAAAPTCPACGRPAYENGEFCRGCSRRIAQCECEPVRAATPQAVGACDCCKANIRELEDERTRRKLAEAVPDLSSEAIRQARAYLKEHLGEQCECAFFDDCIHNAVAIALGARDERDAAVAERDALRAAVEWALGEVGEFPPRKPGEGAYYWRTELRRRAASSAPAEPQR
jgi:hypothetical protein